ncbi:MAG TPA: lysine 2,3-aminomutase [Deltaproteobacteria bacterium]|jgi:lysine 2,3-aminomutase|nr:lysine 2,3-aminomutase [Deltaproteobacteria bacterium]
MDRLRSPEASGFGPSGSRAGRQRYDAWRDIPSSQWLSVRWQLQNTVRTAADVGRLLPLSDAEQASIDRLGQSYRFAVTPYYFSLIDPEDPHDPIRRMIVPSIEEEVDLELGEVDPLGEKADQVAPGLTHRYPDRVLFVVTSFCTSYCRFCIRKRNWRGSDAARSTEEVDQALAYIRSHPEIRDVLVSGGDPLTLPLSQLEYVLRGIREIPHVEIVRIGSREPVMLPMRIEPELVAMLERYSPLWVNTHFNHPNELTQEAAAAIDRLLRAGIPVNNQSVLLAGVNDSLEVMKALVQGLLRIRVRPYYLYHCDDVKGTAHLRTSIRRGLEILEGLRGHTTGFAVPTYVVDAPDGGGKIPLMPNYLVSQGERTLVLRNFEGVLVSVADEAPVAAAAKINGDGQLRRRRTRRPAQSVSDLLADESQRLVPAGLPHYERREALRSEPETAGAAASVSPAARPEPPSTPAPRTPRTPRTRRAARDLRVIQGS